MGCSTQKEFPLVSEAGEGAATIAEMTRNLWTREVTAKSRWREQLSVLLPGLFGFSERFGLTNDAPVMQRLRAAYGDKTFADTKIPLYISATDFSNGEQVALNAGRLVDAIRASIAMPNVFKPHREGERLLVDGYLSDPLPVGIAIREGAGEILAMGFEAPYQTRINSFTRFSFQVSSIMSNNLYKANYAFHNLAHHSEIIPIVPQFTQRVGLFDTEKIPYVIEEGERATEEQLP